MALRRRSSVTQLDAPGDDVVASSARRIGSARRLAALLGAGRLAMGGAFLAYPAASVRLLGVDSATAGRVVWLIRMAAVRDAALGAGALASTAAGRGQTAWLVAGALTDAGDASVIAMSVRAGRLGRSRGYLVSAGALAAALAGLASAGGMLRRRG